MADPAPEPGSTPLCLRCRYRERALGLAPRAAAGEHQSASARGMVARVRGLIAELRAEGGLDSGWYDPRDPDPDVVPGPGPPED
jgi:hypothetical protein